MPDGRSTWKWGCGIGCGIILLLALTIGGGGYLTIRKLVREFDAAIATRQQLEERHGPLAAFVPQPDGGIPWERLRIFLAVRDSLSTARGELEAACAAFSSPAEAGREQEPRQGPRGPFGAVKRGILLAGRIADFYAARNRTLLELGMGLGEYAYLYSLSYYALLQRSPTDGPQHVHMRGDDDPQGTEIVLGDQDPDQMEETIREGQAGLRRDLRSILRNQLDAADAVAGVISHAWRDSLAAELAALQDDPDRFPWQDGLPEVIAAALAPHRQQLAATYSPEVNIFELLRNRKSGWSIRTE